VYGVETFVNRLAFHLAQLGFDVETFPPFGRRFFRTGSARKIRRDSHAKLVSWRRVLANPGLLHLNYALVSLPLVLRPTSKLSPIVYTIHGFPRPDVESQPLYKIGYVLESQSLLHVARRASTVVAISYYARDLLKRSYAIDASVIPNGVDTDLFHPLTSQEKTRVKLLLQVPEGKRIVLFVGRLHLSKDPMTFVRCIPKVLQENPNAYCVMIGDGPLTRAVELEASRLRLDSSLRLISRVEHSKVIQWFQIADIFVSTSPVEMFGISVLEAMSTALPVVAADSGGPLEILGSDGIFFKSGSSEDLAEKICDVIRDGKWAVEKGERGRETALRGFRWEDIAKKYASLYEHAGARP
jgi:glycosyltransferase involved in cell wall biosynthesis